jgi:superfamily II DNA or RNA helicase
VARLEDLAIGSSVRGLLAEQAVTVVALTWYGDSALEVTYKDPKGLLANTLLYREDEARLSVLDHALPWSFDADGNEFRLVSEAYRIHLAHLFDPYLAIYTSAIEPLPHQILAVYQAMLPRMPLRYILADDPGAGKTIMTGLLIKELLARGALKRCLVVSPGSLAEQWQDEMYRKFDLRFSIITNDAIESAVTGNVFTETNMAIVRLDKLARDEALQEKLRSADWDLIVCDEAHKMSATVWGGEVKYTKRFQLGRLLSSLCRHFLLLTATPHNGKEEDFQLFLSLIDPDRFEGVAHTGPGPVDVSDIMRRLVKEELLKFDGTPLFPERRAYTLQYELSPLEARLYAAVTEYVQQEFNRADQLTKERKTTVGFALTILQRRLASSPEAILQSLRRRRERLEDKLAEERLGKRAADTLYAPAPEDEEDDFTAAELEEAETQVADQASAASTVTELETEISTLRRLERLAGELRASGLDRKWDELSKLLQDTPTMFGSDGTREKLIIFTEHRDTLRYLTERIRSLLGRQEAVVNIHGGMLRGERRKVEELFKQDKEVRILVATDAAGEGINLQRAYLMVNYDLPWNPNRLEQRFGRIHRIGQTEVCHLWNLVAHETREGIVFARLLAKLEQERAVLGGRVFDVLGKVSFDNRPLRELLIEAVRYGNDPAVRERLHRVVDHTFDRSVLEKLLAEQALTGEAMDARQVTAIREDLERLEARRLQPHFIETFFIEAFVALGGKIRPREAGRYEISFVPFAVRNRDLLGGGEPVLSRYERICFDKAHTAVPNLPPAALLAPGHPLLSATIDLLLERGHALLKRGTVFVDDGDSSSEPRLLFYVEDAVQDGTVLPSGGKRVISRQVQFLELASDGTALPAGYAPYLDYRAPQPDEQAALAHLLSDIPWLKGNVESLAMRYAISELTPKHLASVRERKLAQVQKTSKAVKERLTAEIQHWDYRAAELKRQEAAGKLNAKLNSQMAARRAEELAARLDKRLAELETEKLISAMPPRVIGGAIVVPRGLLLKLLGAATPSVTTDALARRRVEQAALAEVLQIERSLGYLPRDVSQAKCGYDVESLVPLTVRGGDSPLRFIEVKGRAPGAETVTVTKNEILTAFNKPDEFILALVEVSDTAARTLYLKRPFRTRPDFAATSVNYNLAELVRGADVILKRG